MIHDIQIVAWVEIIVGVGAVLLHAVHPKLDLYKVGGVLAITGVLLFVFLKPLNAGIP